MIKRKSGINIWIVVVLAWAFIRAYFVNDIFQKYGVNATLYLLIDLASSIPYAITSGKALFAYLDRKRKAFLRQVTLAIIFFYLPDIYIIISAQRVPSGTYIGLFFWVFLMSTLAIIKFIRDKKSSGSVKDHLT